MSFRWPSLFLGNHKAVPKLNQLLEAAKQSHLTGVIVHGGVGKLKQTGNGQFLEISVPSGKGPSDSIEYFPSPPFSIGLGFLQGRAYIRGVFNRKDQLYDPPDLNTETINPGDIVFVRGVNFTDVNGTDFNAIYQFMGSFDDADPVSKLWAEVSGGVGPYGDDGPYGSSWWKLLDYSYNNGFVF